MLATVIGAVSVWPVIKLVFGFESATLLNVTLELNGTFGPPLYMSFP